MALLVVPLAMARISPPPARAARRSDYTCHRCIR